MTHTSCRHNLQGLVRVVLELYRTLVDTKPAHCEHIGLHASGSGLQFDSERHDIAVGQPSLYSDVPSWNVVARGAVDA
jgi:hypothetical protein